VFFNIRKHRELLTEPELRLNRLNIFICTSLVVHVLNKISVPSVCLYFNFVYSSGLEDWASRVRFPAEARKFPLHHCVQNNSGAHPPSYPVGGSIPRGKAAGA